MGCGCAVARFGWATSSDARSFRRGSSDSDQSSRKAFPDVVFPSPSGLAGLTFIQEDDGTEQQVLFLDIVLLGPHASAVAEGACSGADAAGGAGSRRPSFGNNSRRPSGLLELSRQNSKTAGDALAEKLSTVLRGGAAGPPTSDAVVRSVSVPAAPPRSSSPSGEKAAARQEMSVTPPSPDRVRPPAPPDPPSPSGPLLSPTVVRFDSEAPSLPAEGSASAQGSASVQSMGFRRASTEGNVTSLQVQRRGSDVSRLSAEPLDDKKLPRRFSRCSTDKTLGLGQPLQYTCHCQVKGYKATVHLWPVETVSHKVPNFSVSQVASTGYVALLPVDSPSLSEECDTVKQRFDEVRFHTARMLASGSAHHVGQGATVSSGPRLGRVALYNTEGKAFNTIEICNPTDSEKSENGEAAAASGPASTLPNASTNPDVGRVAGVTADIGMADLCDTSSLFQTIVVKTSEWLLSSGAVGQKASRSHSDLNLHAGDTGKRRK